MIRSVICSRIGVDYQSKTIDEKNLMLADVLKKLIRSNYLPWKYFNLDSADFNLKEEVKENNWPISVPVTLKNFPTIA